MEWMNQSGLNSTELEWMEKIGPNRPKWTNWTEWTKVDWVDRNGTKWIELLHWCNLTKGQ